MLGNDGASSNRWLFGTASTTSNPSGYYFNMVQPANLIYTTYTFKINRYNNYGTDTYYWWDELINFINSCILMIGNNFD